MIAGIGTDIVSIARMLRLLERHGETAAKKILSGEEFEIFRRRFGSCSASSENGMGTPRPHPAAAFLAKCFAAKEALAKAFGTGLREPLLLSAITIRKNPLGQPFFAYAPELAAWIESRHVTACLSISDERDYALAFAVLEYIPPAG
ncbi:MAG: holo-ACP synthase [Candidatus Accumulibacter sp.]|jgi:holo-[acyl-carrier protein] synthase|nr:holo-ACP synthase [Accumulibacter sp.]